MAFSFDTSAFVGPWRRHYRPKNFPTFWKRIDILIREGDIRAIDEVREELSRQDDELLDWIEALETVPFEPISLEIQQAVKEVLQDFPRLVDNRRNRSGADPFVIAHARVRGLSVVTTEFATGKPGKPHIPDVCSAMGIPCLGLAEFIEECGWVF